MLDITNKQIYQHQKQNLYDNQIDNNNNDPIIQSLQCSSTTLTGPSSTPQGNIVTYNATVFPNNAVYNVTFRDGGNILGTVTSNNIGEATFRWNTSGATIGNHSITVDVGGLCPSTPLVVNIFSPTCNILLNTPTTVTVNDLVPLTATITPSTGFRIAFRDGDNLITTGMTPDVNGTVTFMWAATGTGIHSMSAVGIPTSGPIQCVSNTVDVNVVLPTCSVSLGTSTAEATVGTSITLTAIVSPPGTYNVEFRDGATILQVLTSDSTGIAQFNWNTTGQSPGIHLLTANVITPITCTSPAIGIILSPVCQSITLTANPTTVIQNDSITLTATASPAASYSIDFKDGPTLLGAVVSNPQGVASFIFNTSGASIGIHNLTASIENQCVSTIIPVVINTPTCNISLTTNPLSTEIGNPITLTATVNPPGVYNVIFKDGPTQLISITSDSTGTAIFNWNTVGQTLGPHNLTASIITPISCVSSPVTVTLTLTCSSISLIPSVTSAKQGEMILLTAVVSPPGEFDIAILDGANILSLIRSNNSGVATFNWDTTGDIIGTHNLTAKTTIPPQCISPIIPINITQVQPPPPPPTEAGISPLILLLGLGVAGLLLLSRR